MLYSNNIKTVKYGMLISIDNFTKTGFVKTLDNEVVKINIPWI